MNQAILLVEDDGSLNRGISLKLEKEGYTVCRAETLREARRLYQEGDFALIICDIGLPDGSIGDALYRAKITLSTGELFAWTFVIIVLSAAFEKLFLALLDKAVARVLGEEAV